MKLFLTVIKYDYLQRTRTYGFLITLCASLAIAYTFVPEPNANYSTLRIGDYIGYYNSSWFGYVTAIMSSVFLSMIGFYLVNSGVKTDFDTKIGQIIATTPTSNLKYLLYKTISNFLVLLTIVGIVFLMSIALFFLYHGGYSLELYQFIVPYLLITFPAVFFIAALAVIFEVIFGKYTVIQNIGFFFLFSALMFISPDEEHQFATDVFGSKIVVQQMEEQVQGIRKAAEKPGLSIGYVIGNHRKTNRFEFNGIDFPTYFVLSRLVWIGVAFMGIALIAPFFHRFDKRVNRTAVKTSKRPALTLIKKEIQLSKLALPPINYSIFPLIKTELQLLIRKGKKWHWFINFTGMVLLTVVPIKISHQIVLPILWFLQVGRLSDLTIKEQLSKVHYFAFTSYKPVHRLLFSQWLSGILLLFFLALPLFLRYVLLGNTLALFSVLLGSIFIVVTSSFLGVISKGKKLFEVLFFMITYANINGIAFVDYFGGWTHHPSYVVQFIFLILILGCACILLRNYQLKTT